jgi:hypothetical protein
MAELRSGAIAAFREGATSGDEPMSCVEAVDAFFGVAPNHAIRLLPQDRRKAP